MTEAKRERKPDWNEFYKHGIPKEVIVIDDDESPGQGRAPQTRPNQTSRSIATNGSVRHADKKRKTAASTRDPANQKSALYSNTRSSSNDDLVSRYAYSTDRTTSAMNTTAPTSLGSQVSNGVGAVAGQKRKRETRQPAVEDSRRREIEYRGDPYSTYVPPPRPPIKAKDVEVAVISDVSGACIVHYVDKAHVSQRTATALEKVDDEDGHYIVHENTPLTDRCEHPLAIYHLRMLLTFNLKITL